MKKLALIPTLLFVVVMTMGASMAFYYFDASQITSGTLDAARLPTSIPALAINADQITGGNLSTNRLPATISATTEVETGAGSNSAPSFSFIGDPDTGMYSGGTNILAFATAAACRIIVNASGSTTIGATDLATSYGGTTPKFIADGAVAAKAASGGVAGLTYLDSSTIDNSIYPSTFFAKLDNGVGNFYGAMLWTLKGSTPAAPSSQFEIKNSNGSDAAMQTAFLIDGSNEIFFPGLGTTTATAANAVLEGSPLQLKIVSSLRKLKTDINPIGIDWNKFMSLNPVSFKQKSDPKGPTIYGFIAEEIEKVYKPLAVYAEGKLQSVAYDRVGAVNTAAIQDLKRENDELKARIERLEKILEKRK